MDRGIDSCTGRWYYNDVGPCSGNKERKEIHTVGGMWKYTRWLGWIGMRCGDIVAAVVVVVGEGSGLEQGLGYIVSRWTESLGGGRRGIDPQVEPAPCVSESRQPHLLM